MKKLHKLILVSLTLFLGQRICAQEAEKPEPSINTQYFSENGRVQYLKVKAMVKVNGKLKPLPAAKIQLFLDEQAPDNLIENVKTDEQGKAMAIIPPALQKKWNLSTKHTFLSVYEATKAFAAATSETEIRKLKIVFDTLNEGGTRKVSAQVLAFDSSWQPVKDVEVKLGVHRLGGDLKIGEEESYASDSLGQLTAEFKLDKLPAIDTKNNLVLVAKTEENDTYGNVSFEKIVPWGVYTKPVANFGQRSLWATRDKAPIWLMAIALSIILSVWGVIVYLIFQIRKIKRLGKNIPIRQEPSLKVEEIAEV
jgi:hypothetical protein